jgi:large subunit ribosomal protein L13
MKTTYNAKPEELNDRWVHIDATGQVLGRLAVVVAMRLMGKHRPTYTPHVDTGDNIVITNASRVRVTGRKAEQKVYRHHTGHIGGLVERPFAELFASKPEEVLELAVRRMLPKSKLGRKLIGKLKIYSGDSHPHAAQQPETIKL